MLILMHKAVHAISLASILTLSVMAFNGPAGSSYAANALSDRE